MAVVVDNLYLNTPVIELYPSDFVIVDGRARLIYDRFPEIYGLPGFVEFYAPWCPHCVSFKDDWVTLANVAYGNDFMDPLFAITSFNCTTPDCGPFLKSIGVDSYPTFFGFSNDGFLISYDGNRKQKSFLGWLCNTAGVCQLT
jgi:hypothetical protein